MTRRIAWTILVTVWAMMIAGGLVTYVTARLVLLGELDASLAARACAVPELARFDSGGLTRMEKGDRYLVQNERGQVIGRPRAEAGPGPRATLHHAGFGALADGTRIRTVTVKIWPGGRSATQPGSPLTVVYSGLTERFDQLLSRLALALGVYGAIGAVVAARLAFSGSREALRPLYATAEVIGSIDERNLARRISAADLPRELTPMAGRLNEMLERLERAFEQRKRFLADASHELRTPVSAMVTGMEVALRHPRSAEEYRQRMEACLGDARVLRRLVERLMAQVRSELPEHDEPLEVVDVSAMLRECISQAAVLGEVRNVAVQTQVQERIQLLTQPGRLRSVISNLLANAVEYNRPGGLVEVQASQDGAGLDLVVRDTGVGIPPEHLPHLFEPFYRAGKARAQDDGEHLGLGLYLIQSHLRAIGGLCEVQSQVGAGTTFRVRLPPNDGPAAANARPAAAVVDQ